MQVHRMRALHASIDSFRLTHCWAAVLPCSSSGATTHAGAPFRTYYEPGDLKPSTPTTEVDTGMVSATPRVLPGQAASQLVSLVAGDWHFCGLTAEGSAYCAGDNHLGMLGDDKASSASGSTTLVPVSGGLVFDSLAAGAEITCGLLRSNHTAWCWVSLRWSVQVCLAGGSARLGRGTLHLHAPRLHVHASCLARCKHGA